MQPNNPVERALYLFHPGSFGGMCILHDLHHIRNRHFTCNEDLTIKTQYQRGQYTPSTPLSKMSVSQRPISYSMSVSHTSTVKLEESTCHAPILYRFHPEFYQLAIAIPPQIALASLGLKFRPKRRRVSAGTTCQVVIYLYR